MSRHFLACLTALLVLATALVQLFASFPASPKATAPDAPTRACRGLPPSGCR